MKRIFAFLLSIGLIAPYMPYEVYAVEEDDNYFVVTAYYSPLPDQEYYITGDYQKELRLNGQGIAGASGKGVFSGMLAAPKKYSFGTKIYLDGLGIGSVEDRGGAIVPAGERGYNYDRIDVWMGYGDEGLRRANFWGKRKVYGYVVDPNNVSNIDYTDIPAPAWAVTGLKKAGSNITINTPVLSDILVTPEKTIFDTSLSKASDSESIAEMQSIFDELGLMTRSYEKGVYDESTIDNIVDFQMSHELISDPYELGAGSYGPKTRAKLKEVYDEYLKKEAEKALFLEKLDTLEAASLEDARSYVESIGKPVYGNISPSVRELQISLRKLGYFDYKDTAIFGVKTKNGIIEYQISAGLIENPENIGAGVFGPKTRESFTSDIAHIYFIETLKAENMYDRYIELNTGNKELEEVSIDEEMSILSA